MYTSLVGQTQPIPAWIAFSIMYGKGLVISVVLFPCAHVQGLAEAVTLANPIVDEFMADVWRLPSAVSKMPQVRTMQ